MHNLSNAHQSGPQAPAEFPAPIGRLLGLMLLQQGNGHAIIEFNADQRYANPMGTLHGGVLCDLADAAMGLAYRSTLAEDETFTTIELKINFLRPIWRAKLRAEARIVRAGKVLGLVECDIFDDQRRLVARASSTCMTLRGERAQSRQLVPKPTPSAEPVTRSDVQPANGEKLSHAHTKLRRRFGVSATAGPTRIAVNTSSVTEEPSRVSERTSSDP
jgi:uncharacterized protein (TIGR00369 family)